MYKTNTQLWEEHISLFDGVIEKKMTSKEIFVDGGCGKERFVERYANRFNNCIGIDTNIKPRNKKNNNVHFIKGDLESIHLKQNLSMSF